MDLTLEIHTLWCAELEAKQVTLNLLYYTFSVGSKAIMVLPSHSLKEYMKVQLYCIIISVCFKFALFENVLRACCLCVPGAGCRGKLSNPIIVSEMTNQSESEYWLKFWWSSGILKRPTVCFVQWSVKPWNTRKERSHHERSRWDHLIHLYSQWSKTIVGDIVTWFKSWDKKCDSLLFILLCFCANLYPCEGKNNFYEFISTRHQSRPFENDE